VPKLTEATKEQFIARFAKIQPNAQPLWGKMTGAQMIGHVDDVLRYTLCETPLVPFRGNFKFQYIFAPLLLNGILKFPKNVQIPRSKGAPPLEMRDGDLESFKKNIDRVLAEAREGTFKPPHHPYFGNIGPDRWLKFHGAHFDHHLRQFGV